ELTWGPKYRHADKPPNQQRPDRDSFQQPPHHPSNPRSHPSTPTNSINELWFPEFLGPDPLFDQGRAPLPPPLIIYQRVDVDTDLLTGKHFSRALSALLSTRWRPTATQIRRLSTHQIQRRSIITLVN